MATRAAADRYGFDFAYVSRPSLGDVCKAAGVDPRGALRSPRPAAARHDRRAVVSLVPRFGRVRLPQATVGANERGCESAQYPDAGRIERRLPPIRMGGDEGRRRESLGQGDYVEGTVEAFIETVPVDHEQDLGRSEERRGDRSVGRGGASVSARAPCSGLRSSRHGRSRR